MRVERGPVAERLGHREPAGIGVGTPDLKAQTAGLLPRQADMLGQEFSDPVGLFKAAGKEESGQGQA